MASLPSESDPSFCFQGKNEGPTYNTSKKQEGITVLSEELLLWNNEVGISKIMDCCSNLTDRKQHY